MKYSFPVSPAARIAVVILFAFIGTAVAAPSHGDEHFFRQPDGSKVPVIVWGDEFYQHVESLDGFTLIRNADGWICYAELSVDGNEYVSTGVRYTENSRAPDVPKGLRISRESVREKVHRAREELGYYEMLREGPRRHPRTSAAATPARGIRPAPAEPERVVGLVIPVEFADEKVIHTQSDIEEFFNRPGGINGANPAGSVYDYFYDVSNGLMEYTNIIAPVVTLPNEKSYYNQSEIGQVSRVWVLITEALNILDEMNFDLSAVTLDDSNRVAVLNIFFAGGRESGALSSHASIYRGGAAINGTGFYGYQISYMGTDSDLSARLSLVVHENGHVLMRWPDVYRHSSPDIPGHELGNWCVMAYSTAFPQQPNAYFRYLAGWIDTTDITGAAAGTVLAHTANSHSAYIYRRNGEEAYFIEARRNVGIRNQGLRGSGLAIWHVHSRGSNVNTSPGFPLVELMQADGRNDLGNRGSPGDATDLFRLGVKTRFNKTTTPAAIYHDGTPSDIGITHISAAGEVMTFTVGGQDYAGETTPLYDFYYQIETYSTTAAGDVEITVNQNLTLDMLVDVFTPATEGATLTIRSADPASPVTLTRGASGDLFTVAAGAVLVLENVIIDGGGDFADGGGTLIRVNVNGTFAMNNGAVVRNNVTAADGGGVWVRGGTFIMNGGEITGNTSTGNGGGVRVINVRSGDIGQIITHVGTFIMNNGKISGNTAISGGGAHIDHNSVFTMTGGVVAGTGANIHRVVSGSYSLNDDGGDGVIIMWNKPDGDGPFDYTPGTSEALAVLPDGDAASAVWSVDGDGVLGILYENGDNTGFIAISAMFPVLVLSPDRIIPQSGGEDGVAIVAPVNVLTAKFTAGPNPVARSLGAVTFYRQGKRVNNAALTIFDASGNVVNKIRINDNAINDRRGDPTWSPTASGQSKRVVGSWDLTDRRGRLVSDGTYLVRGVITTSDGKRERVSVVVGVR